MKTKKGYFGEFGGSFVTEKLQKDLDRIEKYYNKLKHDKNFIKELNELRKDFQGRPTPLYFCKRLTEKIGGAKIYLKREDLNHTGAHKINHCLGEMLLAKYMGKSKVIAETGAGQHGLALATAAAYFGFDCEIYMGKLDIEKQKINVEKIKLLGAKVIPVNFGRQTLKEAVDSAFEAYSKDPEHIIYCIGSVVGPHPFPTIVRDFQSVISKEIKSQFKKKENRMPDAVVACVGGGSNAMGAFAHFIKDKNVKLFGVEPMGKGTKIGENAASITFGEKGIMHGFKSLMLKGKNGEPANAYSIASGLDYPAVGPEHAYLNSIKRVNYVSVTDKEALDAFFTLCKLEGIIPALESSHALAYAIKLAKTMNKFQSIVVNLSGRGDKDCEFIFKKYKSLI